MNTHAQYEALVRYWRSQGVTLAQAYAAARKVHPTLTLPTAPASLTVVGSEHRTT